ncbi:MAG TPA: hypothetical protein VIN07_05700 [Flavipsychrobacter sp.]
MRDCFTLLGVIVSWLTHTLVCAQPMQGHVLDVSDGKPVQGVVVYNIYTEEKMISSNEGAFTVIVEEGHLVEFRKDGYKVLRVRIPQGKRPSYFRVMMQELGTDVEDYMHSRRAAPDYKTDSAKYYALYKESLEVPRLTGIDVIQHPFSAMSKKNRQIWAFQDEYRFYQEQKYIDYTFNPKLVHRITGLEGDSLQGYMELFRPTYEQLRSMSEYTYFNYIKRTAEAYRRRGIRSKWPHSRGSQ